MTQEQDTLDGVNKFIVGLQKDKRWVESCEKGFYVAKITDITPMTSHEFFVVQQFESRDGLQITVDDGLTFFIPIPKSLIGSQMGAFIQRYGKMPEVDMKIDIDTTQQYSRIKLSG